MVQLETLTSDQLAEADVPAVVEHLRALQRFRNRLDAYESSVLEAVLGSGVAVAAGERNLADALAKLQRVSRREARRKQKAAEARAASPDAADAFDHGDINTEQMNDLAGADVGNDTRRRLVDEARNQTPDQTRRAVQQAEEREREETADERQQRLHRKRTGRRFVDRDGMHRFEFALDPASAAPVSATLSRLVERLWQHDKRRGDNDGRRNDQRLADALVYLCREAQGDVGSGSSRGPGQATVSVRVDREWLAGSTDASGITDQGITLAPTTLRELACDAQILPIVMGGRSEVLDVGRRRRTVSDAQRRALVARDGGCARPGCDAPPDRCHAHHLIHWVDGGPTDLSNLVLVCHADHTWLHQAGMTLARGPGGVWREVPYRGPDPARSPSAPPTGQPVGSDDLLQPTG